MKDLTPGSIFASRYRVQHEIARGGMGIVYAAEHLETEQDVALKVIFASVGASGAAMDGFKLEAKIAARLDSEHVVRVLDAGVDRETRLAFLTMERLSGQTLAALLEKEEHLDPALVADIFRDLGRALDRAHHHKDKSGALRPIVHRDLKPENLFLAEVPDRPPRLKVLDFGLAKIVSQDDEVSGGIKGTPLYMSHEQLAGRPITPRTDVWAMGLVAFRLLTGKHYWLAANERPVPATQLFAEVLHEKIVGARERAAHLGVAALLPDGFDEWFARCVTRLPEDRFETAREASNALRELLGAELSVIASPKAPRASLGKGKGSGASTSEPTAEPAMELAATVKAEAGASEGSAPATKNVERPRPAILVPVALAVVAVVVFLVMRGG